MFWDRFSWWLGVVLVVAGEISRYAAPAFTPDIVQGVMACCLVFMMSAAEHYPGRYTHAYSLWCWDLRLYRLKRVFR